MSNAMRDYINEATKPGKMQHDEHVSDRYRHNRDIYLSKSFPTPESARVYWYQLNGWAV